jgi:hypothetical protein
LIGSAQNPETIDPPLSRWNNTVLLDHAIDRDMNIGHFNLVHETKK